MSTHGARAIPLAVEVGLLARLRRRAAELAEVAIEDDRLETFPDQALGILREAGCLAAVLPAARGGQGLGWSAGAADVLRDVLRAIGGIHLSAARLFEGHVNAFQLLWTHGDRAQRERLCDYVDAGELLGVWNALHPSGELLLADTDGHALALKGTKAYASGAGGIRRPLVTARHPELGLLMVWPEAEYSVGPASEWTMHGMRSSLTRSVHFDGRVDPTDIFGHDNDYHRQPDFSAGSWRFLAAQLGAGEALLEMMRAELLRRGRALDTHQRSRMTQCLLALETSLMWITDTARLAAAGTARPEMVIQRANAARIVVERSLLDVMERVHRSIGLQSFSRASPMERVMRDLATYLRQPAPDALVDAVGEKAFATPLPGLLAGAYESEQ